MLSLACRMEAQKREEELLKEKEAQEARLRALEEQVRQGKIRKQEEKRRKEEAERLAKEKEAALAAQRAEIERAKERERQLQLELERLDEESSSDDEGPVNITPEDSTPTQSQLLPTVTPAAPVSAPESEQAGSPEDTSSQAPPVDFKLETESKNPYFKITHQATDTQVVSSPPVPQPSFTSPKADVHSTNPFHRLAKQETSKPAFTGSAPLERKSRARPEADDDWSAAGSEFDSSDDDDDERPGGGSAKQLASILFGTMAPPVPSYVRWPHCPFRRLARFPRRQGVTTTVDSVNLTQTKKGIKGYKTSTHHINMMLSVDTSPSILRESWNMPEHRKVRNLFNDQSHLTF